MLKCKLRKTKSSSWENKYTTQRGGEIPSPWENVCVTRSERVQLRGSIAEEQVAGKKRAAFSDLPRFFPQSVPPDCNHHLFPWNFLSHLFGMEPWEFYVYYLTPEWPGAGLCLFVWGSSYSYLSIPNNKSQCSHYLTLRSSNNLQAGLSGLSRFFPICPP